jgi:endonuclease YncB( thermonuclease family)
MIEGRRVELPGGAWDDRDRYGRILRYVDVDGQDAGRALIVLPGTAATSPDGTTIASPAAGVVASRRRTGPSTASALG